MTADFHEEMVKRSLISSGNNHRMKRAIHKARQGENTTIVYLGGSITMRKKELGDRGYADASFKFFKNHFAPDGQLTYINSGMNGTSSLIGLIRSERDVLKFLPDIVFVEFSVNDSKDSLHREVFESLIVRLLESESKPAVVLLFLQSEGGYSCQGHMQVIGEHYKLPMISVCDAIQAELEAGRIKWSEYADDNIHPNLRGNDLIVELIANYYRTVDRETEDKEEDIPKKPFYGTAYKNMMLLDAACFKPLSTGGFKRANTIDDFPNGWVRDTHKENGEFTFKLRFKHLFIIYKESRNMTEGSIVLTVDGKEADVFSGYRTFGWNNPAVRQVYSEDEEGEHLVGIRMVKEDEDKDFTLLAVGYC